MPDRSVIAIAAHPNIGKISEDDYFRLYRAVAGRSRPILGRARQADRLDQALYARSERLLRRRRVDPLVRGRHAQRLLQLHRPPPRDARRPDRDPVGGRRPRRGPARHLPRTARERLPPRERAEGAGRQEGRPGHDLSADDPRGGGRDAGLRPHRRDPFGRVRRLLAGQPRRAHRGLRLDGADHRRRGAARRPQGAAEAQRRHGAAAMPRASRP